MVQKRLCRSLSAATEEVVQRMGEALDGRGFLEEVEEAPRGLGCLAAEEQALRRL